MHEQQYPRGRLVGQTTLMAFVLHLDPLSVQGNPSVHSPKAPGQEELQYRIVPGKLRSCTFGPIARTILN